jgi:hypothetical protein
MSDLTRQAPQGEQRGERTCSAKGRELSLDVQGDLSEQLTAQKTFYTFDLLPYSTAFQARRFLAPDSVHAEPLILLRSSFLGLKLRREVSQIVSSSLQTDLTCCKITKRLLVAA